MKVFLWQKLLFDTLGLSSFDEEIRQWRGFKMITVKNRMPGQMVGTDERIVFEWPGIVEIRRQIHFWEDKRELVKQKTEGALTWNSEPTIQYTDYVL